jgi:hypothetical protein
VGSGDALKRELQCAIGVLAELRNWVEELKPATCESDRVPGLPDETGQGSPIEMGESIRVSW